MFRGFTESLVVRGVLAVWACLSVAGCGEQVELPAYCPPEAYDALQAGRLKPLVEHFADPAAGGRMTGTAGNDRAADRVVEQFRQAGLQPAGDAGTFRQRFPLGELRVPAPISRLSAGELKFDFGRDFLPMAGAVRGAFQAPLVFAGYGVKNRVRGYDSYRNLSARGCVVLLLQGEPHDKTGQSDWALKGKWTELTELRRKLRTARDAGAVGALIVSPPALARGGDPLEDVLPPKHRGPIPAMRITRAAANRLLRAGGREQTVGQLVEDLRGDALPEGFAVGVKVAGRCDFVPGVGENLLGVLPAGKHYATAYPAEEDPEDDLGPAPPVVVLGAHYDHLPATGQQSRDGGFGVRPGGDDNASGLAVLCQLAEALAKIPERNCEYVFVAFDAEEIGFLGSKHYVQHPVRPLDRTALMINIDQIGRLRDEEVIVIGAVNNATLKHCLLEGNGLGAGLKVTSVPLGKWSFWSDDAAFAAEGVRTLFFFTGLHRDYHTRRDTAAKVNLEGMSRVGRLIFDTLRFFDEAHAPPPAGR